MSSNQRPTGVRVISSQSNRLNPRRRRGDPKGPVPAPVLTEEEQQEIAALRRERAEQEALAQSQEASRSNRMMLGLIFIIGCALGGAALTFLKIGALL